MEDKYFNILWIDDEHEGMSGFKGDAKFNGIHLIAFKSLNKGISELKKNYPMYDGVLLDAKFFENEDDVKGSEDTDNVHRAKEELLLLPKKFKVFVLTGQAEAYEDKTFNKAFKRVYKKGVDNDIEQLFIDIKTEANQLKDTQTRHEYSRVFDVCTERYIGETAAHDLLDLLNYNGSETGKFNQIRKIVEDVFISFNKYDLLPSEYIQTNIALNQSSKFLCGQEQDERTSSNYKKYKLNDDAVVPNQIAYYLRSILSVTQDGSHRSNVDMHVKNLKTPYLLRSVLFQLLDVLVWFKQYVDSKPKTKNWEELDANIDVSENNKWIEGEVINFNSLKGYAFLSPNDGSNNQLIPPHLVTNHNLSNGSLIKGEVVEYTDNRSGILKTIVKRIEL
jgi:cold shock CspA family protein